MKKEDCEYYNVVLVGKDLSEKKVIEGCAKSDGCTCEVVDSRALVSFLYELMRDHVPVGIVELLLQHSPSDRQTAYTNGRLAEYAREVADRLDVVRPSSDEIFKGFDVEDLRTLLATYDEDTEQFAGGIKDDDPSEREALKARNSFYERVSKALDAYEAGV